MHEPMTKQQLDDLRTALERLIVSGATTDEIEEWADAYEFSRADLIDLYRSVRA